MFDYEDLILEMQEKCDCDDCGMTDEYDYAISDWFVRKLETNLVSEKGEFGWHVQEIFWEDDIVRQTEKAMLVRLDHFYRMSMEDEAEHDEFREIWIPKSCVRGA